MAKLEELTPGSLVKGILPDALAELVSAKWHGSDVIEVVYKDPAGRVGTELLFRDREPALELLTAGRPWSFDGDGRLFRLVSEAHPRYVRQPFQREPDFAVTSVNYTLDGLLSHATPPA